MRFSRHAIEDVFRLMLWYPYRWGVSFMPPAAELGLSRQLGRVIAWTHEEDVDRVEANLRRAFPGRSDLRALAYQCIERRIEDRYLSLSFEKLDRSTLAEYVTFEGLGWLDEALSRGRGCILAFPHCGATMLALFGLGLLKYPLSLIAASPEPPQGPPAAVAAFMVRRHLLSLIPAKILNAETYLRPTLRRLKEGELVMVSYDGSGQGDEVGRRVTVNLFGQPVSFPVGALYLALRSGAPLLPIVTIPYSGLSAYKTVISPEFEVEHVGDLSESLRHNAQRLAHVLERVLLEQPDGWLLWPDFEPGRMVESQS